MEGFDAKYLTGIKMTGGDTKIVEKDGRKKRQSTPWERAAKEEDVLSFVDRGTHVWLVIKNGKKYKVEKGQRFASKKEAA